MIQSVRLQNFRSYTDDSFEFESGVNIIVGPNGSGKTNLIEAIMTLATGSSYRVDDMELIRHQQPWARVDAIIEGKNRTIKLEQTAHTVKKSYVFDDKPYKILTHNHTLPVVLFEPNHLLLLHAQPEGRRLYLDALLEQARPDFKSIRKQYRRVLTQRNSLLKTAASHKRSVKEQLFVWNLRLSELGGSIARSRAELVDEIQTVLPTLYKSIAGSAATDTAISYKSRLPLSSYETAFLKALEQSYEQDVARGFTGYGPHRDDFEITYDGHAAAEVASRGETRTAVLALKVFELNLLEQVNGLRPLLLLDDVFSELDGKRRHSLASYLQSHQTFITTTDADLVLDSHMKSSHIIPITSG